MRKVSGRYQEGVRVVVGQLQKGVMYMVVKG